jgi:hypothetical protein
MTQARDERAKEIQGAIREILFHDWDPLSVGGNVRLREEYDSYIAPIYRLLTTAPSREDVARELKKIESESMGFDQASEAALLPVADRLLSIDVRLTR